MFWACYGAAMSIDPVSQRASNDVGGYLLKSYGGMGATLHAANGVSALGALAGVFAQVQARAMLATGAIVNSETTLIEIRTTTGGVYYYGEAINACLLEGSRERPSFWNLAAGAAHDPEIGDKVGLDEITEHVAQTIGTPTFGAPRIDARYKLTQMPIDAVLAHGVILQRRFRQMGLNPAELMVVFGAVAQGFATFAAGEQSEMTLNVAMTRVDIVRLYMESAIAMSKLDLRSVGMAN